MGTGRASERHSASAAVPVNTGSHDDDGRLVLADGRLVAVLVRLADQAHAEQSGAWFLEAGFGPCAGAQFAVFDSLDVAQDWVRRKLGA